MLLGLLFLLLSLLIASCTEGQYFGDDDESRYFELQDFDFYKTVQPHHYKVNSDIKNRSSSITDQLQAALWLHHDDSTSIAHFVERYGQPLWQLSIDKGAYHLVPTYDHSSSSLAGVIYCVVDDRGGVQYNAEDNFEGNSPTVKLLDDFYLGKIVDFELSGFRFFDVRSLETRAAGDDCEPMSVVKFTQTYMEIATGEWVQVSSSWEVLYTIDCATSAGGGGGSGNATDAQLKRREACEKAGESWQNCLLCKYNYNEVQGANAVVSNPSIGQVMNNCGCGEDFTRLVASTTTLVNNGIDVSECAQCDKAVLTSLTSVVRDFNQRRHVMFETDCGSSGLTDDDISDMLSDISTDECDLGDVQSSLFLLAQTQIDQKPWNSTSPDERANSLRKYMWLRNFQNRCGDGYSDFNLSEVFEFGELLTLGNNEFFTSDFCIDAVPLGSTMISFQGTGGCQTCMSTSACPRQLPDGRVVVEYPPCNVNCSQVGGSYGQPCMSFTMSQSDADTFLSYISTEGIPCP